MQNNNKYNRAVTIEDLYIIFNVVFRVAIYGFVICATTELLIDFKIISGFTYPYGLPTLNISVLIIMSYVIKMGCLKRIEEGYLPIDKDYHQFIKNPKHLEIIKNTLSGCKGKRVAIILSAARDLGWLDVSSGEYSRLYNMIRRDFGYNIGSNESITKYLIGRKRIEAIEIERMKIKLTSCI